MSIFRPHKTKPRQFNYTPRYYDPIKEAFDQRRRELHGTSSETDNLPYQPGDYLRMKKEARRESREEQSKAASNRLLRYGILIVAVGLGFAYIMPHATEFITRFLNGGQATEVVEGEATFSADSTAVSPAVILNEQHGDIDFTEFETLSPEIINEIEVYNMLHPNINIYPDDVEIVDGKRVESKE